MDERPRDLQPPPLAARQRVGRVAGKRGGGPSSPAGRAARCRRSAAVEVERFQDGHEIFLDRQFAEYRRFSGKYPTPIRQRWYMGSDVISRPSKKIRPPSAGSKPTIM